MNRPAARPLPRFDYRQPPGAPALLDPGSVAWRVYKNQIALVIGGVAAVATAISKVSGRDGEFIIGSGGPGQLTGKLKARLVAIQRGEAADTHGWVTRLD